MTITTLSQKAWTDIGGQATPANGDRSGRHLKGPGDVGHGLALIEELLSGAQPSDDLLGSVTLAFHGASPRQVWPVGKLSQELVQFPGSTSASLKAEEIWISWSGRSALTTTS
jgi:hypothetical protein